MASTCKKTTTQKQKTSCDESDVWHIGHRHAQTHARPQVSWFEDGETFAPEAGAVKSQKKKTCRLLLLCHRCCGWHSTPPQSSAATWGQNKQIWVKDRVRLWWELCLQKWNPQHLLELTFGFLCFWDYKVLLGSNRLPAEQVHSNVGSWFLQWTQI